MAGTDTLTVELQHKATSVRENGFEVFGRKAGIRKISRVVQGIVLVVLGIVVARRSVGFDVLGFCWV